MRDKYIYMLAVICGAVFALMVGYMKMSPSRYILDHYGWLGIVIYTIIGFVFWGVLIYHMIKNERNRIRKQMIEKE